MGKLGHQTWEPPKLGDTAAGTAVSSAAAASSDAVVVSDSPALGAAEAPAPTFHSPAIAADTIAEDANADLPPDFDAEPEVKDAGVAPANDAPAVAAETATTASAATTEIAAPA